MSLVQRIASDLTEALKKKDEVRLSVLRLARSSIKYKVISQRTDGHSKSADELDDQGVIDVLSTMAKQHEESIEVYKKHGHEDRALKEEKELSIIKEYLPTPLSDDELLKLVSGAVKEVGAASPKDMGKVMQALMPKVKGRADGKKVSDLVKKTIENAKHGV